MNPLQFLQLISAAHKAFALFGTAEADLAKYNPQITQLGQDVRKLTTDLEQLGKSIEADLAAAEAAKEAAAAAKSKA